MQQRGGRKRDWVRLYTNFLGRHPRAVVGFWLVVLAASAYNAMQLLNDTVFAFKPPPSSYGVCFSPSPSCPENGFSILVYHWHSTGVSVMCL